MRDFVCWQPKACLVHAIAPAQLLMLTDAHSSHIELLHGPYPDAREDPSTQTVQTSTYRPASQQSSANPVLCLTFLQNRSHICVCPTASGCMLLTCGRQSQSARCAALARALDLKECSCRRTLPHLYNTGQLLGHILSAGWQSVPVVSMTYTNSLATYSYSLACLRQTGGRVGSRCACPNVWRLSCGTDDH